MEITRRNFFKGSATIGAAAFALGAVGCAPQNTPADKTPSSADLAYTGESIYTDPRVREIASVENQEEAGNHVVETVDCDIAVLGSGASGLSAAVRAAELGAKVVLLEKGNEFGGSAVGTEGMFGWNSSLQNEAGVEMLPVAELLQEELTYSNYRIDPILWEKFITSSGNTVDWIRSQGYEYQKVDVYKAGVSTFKCFHWWADDKGQTMIDCLAQRAKDLGVDIRLNTPGVSLKTEGTTVKGAYGKLEDGSGYLDVSAKAVIIGTGGFGNNNPLIDELTWWRMDHGQTLSPGTGDGLLMALDAGADTYMTAFLPRTCIEGYSPRDDAAIACLQPLLYVNHMGLRFMDEGTKAAHYLALYVNAINVQEKAYIILDQTALERFASGDGLYDGWMAFKKDSQIPECISQLDALVDANYGNAFKADTIPELATAMGLDPDTLEQTVGTYNQYCAQGHDDDFLKDPQFLIPCETKPFYAVRLDPCASVTIGGIDVDLNNEVVNQDGEVIAGLYAVGVDACKLYKESYNYAMSGGLVSYCLYSGLNAAQHAFDTYCA